MAICLIALAPAVILVLLLRRFVVQGLSTGAVKGVINGICPRIFGPHFD
jgi:hypothetical protein